jgi:hypothetical protein
MKRKLATLAIAAAVCGSASTLVFAETRGGSADGLNAAISQYGCAANTSGSRCVSTLPVLHVAGVRRACITRSFNIRVHVAATGVMGYVRVYLDGRHIYTAKKSPFTLHINAKRLSAGTHHLRMVATDAAGQRVTETRTIARCAVARHHRRVSPRFTG